MLIENYFQLVFLHLSEFIKTLPRELLWRRYVSAVTPKFTKKGKYYTSKLNIEHIFVQNSVLEELATHGTLDNLI